MSKIGVCEFCLPVWGPFAVDFAANCGFEGIQLTDLRGVYWGFPLTNRFIQEGYLEAAKRTGVTLHSLHLMALSHSTGHYSPENSPKGEQARISLKKGVEACRSLGIQVINLSGVARGEDAISNQIRFLQYAVKTCEEFGVSLAYERGTNFEYSRLLLDSVPGLKLQFQISDFSDEKILSIAPDRLDHVHITCSKYDSEIKTRRDVMASASSDTIRKQICALRELGYDGWYFSEEEYIDFALPEDVERGNYGRGYPEMSTEYQPHPLSFGMGPDYTALLKKNCKELKDLIDNPCV